VSTVTWIRLALAAAGLAALVGLGFAIGHRDVPKLHHDLAALTRERDGLVQANAIEAKGLDAASDALRTIANNLREDASRAARAQASGTKAAADAIRGRAALEADLDALKRQLRDERQGCVDANRPVCGVPLE